MLPSFESEPNIHISDETFAQVQKLLYRLSGIHLSDAKKMLVVSRLGKRMRLLGHATIKDYMRFVSSEEPSSHMELQHFLNALTTNKTDFFRESQHFNYLETEILPRLSSWGVRELRLWSAGCSTGEEAYTMALVCHRALGQNSGISWKILATDIDSNCLVTGQNGVYSREKLYQIPEHYREKCLKIGESSFSFLPILKKHIFFKPLNLMEAYPFTKGFHVAFCRNVLIYFTDIDRKTIVRSIRAHLARPAILCLGHSEALLADSQGFRNLGYTMYQRDDIDA